MKFSRLCVAFLLTASPLVACSSSDDAPAASNPQAATTCSKTCAKVMGAGCENDTTDGCVSDCEKSEEKIPEDCKANYDGLVACIETNGSYSCGNNGKATLSGCDLMQNAFTACLQKGTGGQGGGGSAGQAGSSGSSGKGGQASGGSAGATDAGPAEGGDATAPPVTDITDSTECKTYCDKMKSECGLTCHPSSDCAIKSGQCAESQRAYLLCQATEGSWVCGTDGFSIMSDCKYNNSVCPAAPPVDVSCDPASGDNTCIACAKSSCCSDYKTFFGNPDADKLLECIDTCPTTGCLTICEHDYPEAWDAFSVLGECLEKKCPSCS